MPRDGNGDLIANVRGVGNPFAGYTGERAGYFFDPNWGEYFPISTHAGSYQNWDTGVRSTEGAQPAYSDASRQAEYQIEVRGLPIVTAVDLAAVDLARTSIPGSPQSIATQPVAVPQTLSTTPPPIWRSESVKPAAEALIKTLTTPSSPAEVGNPQILLPANNAAQPKRNWLGWGALLIGLYFVLGE